MVCQGRPKGIGFITKVAFPWFFSSMNNFMPPQNGAVRKFFVTNWAPIGLFSCMFPPVFGQIRFVDSFITTNFATVDGYQVLVDLLAMLLDQMF